MLNVSQKHLKQLHKCMFEINDVVMFNDIDECVKYFHQCCENDVEMLNNVKTFFEYVKNEYDSKNVVYVKYDDTFFIIEKCVHILTNEKFNHVEKYFINDDLLFLHDETFDC